MFAFPKPENYETKNGEREKEREKRDSKDNVIFTRTLGLTS